MRDAAYEPVDAIVLEADLRADFPHDAWWESGILSFSDGSSCQVKFEKTGLPQRFDIGECKIE